MLDDFEGGHQIEGGGRKRHSASGALQKSSEWKMIAGIVDRFGCKIHAHRRECYLCEIRGSVSSATTEIEDSSPLRKTSRQRIPCNVFRPQIVIDLTRNDTLAGEFAHGVVT